MDSKDEKKKQREAGNPIFILIIFAVLIGFIFYIPEIYKKYNEDISNFLRGDKPEEEKDDKDDKKAALSAYYQLGSKKDIKFNEIVVTNISLNSDKTVSFTINTDDTIDLDELDYYVEFYEERTTFVGRRALHGKVTKNRSFALDVSSLQLTTTTFMVLSHISDATIKPLDTTTDESGLSTIKCSRKEEVYEYQFYLKKLSKTTYKYTYSNNNLDEFAASLLEMQKKEKAYNEYTGVNARITENATSYIFLSEFDYENVTSFKRVGDPLIFDKGTLNNVVKFKMDAEGFDCV